MICQLCQTFIKQTPSLLQMFGLIRWQPNKLCQACQLEFVSISCACSGCGRQQNNESLCFDCQRWEKQGKILLQHTALYQYNDAMRDFMQRYKFNGDYSLRQIFNHKLIQYVNNMAIDLVVVIPISEYTMMTRGFNQTVGLFEGVTLSDLLKVKAKNKSHQSQFNRKGRMMRTQPFTVSKSLPLHNKRVLLVDDVYTTGNTLYHAADLLYDLGAKNVKSLSLAR